MNECECLYVHMYVFMYICMLVHNMYVCTYAPMNEFEYKHTCICMYVYMYACT